MTRVDMLAVGAHPDDVDLTCGGTLAAAKDQGYGVAILDLTRGELGTRGSAGIRQAEAAKAAQILGVDERINAELPDAHVWNSDDNRRLMVGLLRSYLPRTVIAPYPVGRHPDHRESSLLVRDSCFLAGLANYPADGEIHKPEKLIYTSTYREDAGKPTFVVDISAQFERKLEAIRCYQSQFEGVVQAGELFPTGQDLYDLVRTQNAHYGSLIRTAYGEPFLSEETVRVDDVVAMGVQSL
ncbi:MAG: bacillithiol biosynthesis deacetylase BshB1 [Gemmatimonadales bacterium]